MSPLEARWVGVGRAVLVLAALLLLALGGIGCNACEGSAGWLLCCVPGALWIALGLAYHVGWNRGFDDYRGIIDRTRGPR